MPNGPGSVSLRSALSLVLSGQPVLPADQISSLAAKDGRFRDGLKTFAMRALANRMDTEQIEAETSAQIRKIQAAGIAVTHFDTHKHTHLFHAILRPLLRAAANCGVRAVRNHFEPDLPLLSQQLLERPNLWVRYAKVRSLRRFAGKFREAVQREGFITVEEPGP